jgi:hypothetical protein
MNDTDLVSQPLVVFFSLRRISSWLSGFCGLKIGRLPRLEAEGFRLHVRSKASVIEAVE